MSQTRHAGLRPRFQPPPDLAGEGLLTTAELAGVLRVSRRTVFRLAAGGEFPEPVRLGSGRGRGGMIRWPKAAIRDFLERNRQPAYPAAADPQRPAAEREEAH